MKTVDPSLPGEALSEETDFERLTREQNEAIASIKDFNASDRLTRDQLHDRAFLRELQRSVNGDK